jgi:hypothetical protein
MNPYDDDDLTDPAFGIFFFVVFALLLFAILASLILFGCRL